MANLGTTSDRSRSPSMTCLGRQRQGAALLPMMLSIALTGCNAPTGEPAGSEANAALSACSRDDVQELVGKEARSKMLKLALPRLIGAAIVGAVDLDQVADDLRKANVSFYDVALDNPAGQFAPPFHRVVCSARLQLDSSDAIAGQQILGVERVRWVVNFTEPVEDPREGSFTVDVDAVSLQRGLTMNGKALASPESQPAQDESDRDSQISQLVDDTAADAQRAAADAEAAVHDDGDAAETPDAPGTSEPVGQPGSQPVASQTPSEDDLYAPHN